MTEVALDLLRALAWQPAFSASLAIQSWLYETGSVTKRFKQYGLPVTINIMFEGFINPEQALEETALLPAEPRYWLREVVLCGGGTPWLAGRTLIPESVWQAVPQLRELGTQPLGQYLFSSAQLTRDFIEPGYVNNLWGRRSRLCLSGRPLLLTELFLPAAPVYAPGWTVL